MKFKLLSGLSLLFLSSLLVACGGGTPTTSEAPTSQEEPTSETVSSEEEVSSTTPIPLEDNKVHLIVLAGQSGARGKGDKTELTSAQSARNEDVYLYQDGHTMAYIEGDMSTEVNGNLDTPTQPGYGDGSGEIGPEIGIAETFRSRYHDADDYKAVIVKYTVCGTDFPNHWYSNSMVEDAELTTTLNKDTRHLRNYHNKQMGPLTRDLYKLLQDCIDELEDMNLEVEIDGLAWVHGEMDAQNKAYVANYEKSLKYFIQDFRDEFGKDIPIVVTGVLTNAAGYRPMLLEAQENVAKNVSGVTLIRSDNLYSNSFEPWHYSAQSNVVLGNEIAASLLENKDTRSIVSLNLDEKYDDVYPVSYGYQKELPEYLPFMYEDGFTGMSRVHYLADYDPEDYEEQEIPFVVRNANGVLYEGKLPVLVYDRPTVDGYLEEDLYGLFPQEIDEDLELYLHNGMDGIYVFGSIKDTKVWSDSELWRVGDMGQKDRNDDVRFFFTGTDASERVTVCLSAANMFRVYAKGRSMNTSVASLQTDNLFYRRTLTNPDYRARINGVANDSTIASIGWDFEFYISYEDLGVESFRDIKFCMIHSNINNPEGISGKGSEPRTGGDGYERYIVRTDTETEFKEENDASYISLDRK